MLVATFFFALMNVCVKYVSHIPAVEIILFRSLISLVISLAMIKRIGISPWGNNKKLLFLRGLFGATALTMYFLTLQKLPLASATTIQYLSPIFTVIFAAIFLGEKMLKLQWLFFGMAFAGAAIIRGFDERVTTPYFLLGLGSAIASGIAYNLVRKLKDSDHPLVVVLYFPLVATPIMAVLSYFQWIQPSGYDWLILLGVGIFTQIAQVNMTKALQSEQLNLVSSLKYLGTIYALSFGYFLFGETYDIATFLGIMLVLLGVVLNVLYKTYYMKATKA